MIISWMLYAFLVALLLAAGAPALERALRSAGRPGRWAWLAAIGGAGLVPAVSLLAAVSGVGSEGVAPVAAVVGPVTVLGAADPGLGAAVGPVLSGLEAPLIRIWVVASLGLLVLLAGSAVRLRRSRQGWSERLVDGGSIFVSDDVGPAVLGLIRPRIVLPRWVLDRSADARSLVLAHEREHCRARDPLLIFLAAIPAVAMPWNLPLWWCLRRLRLAVELDCDERVVRSASPRTRLRYGRLLVEFSRRPRVPLGALAVSERPTALERRVRALADGVRGSRRGRAAGFGGLALALGVAACVVPSPDAPERVLEPDESAVEEAVDPTPEPSASLSDGPVFVPHDTPPIPLNQEETAEMLREAYPPLLRDAGIGGLVSVWLYIQEDGGVGAVEVNESSGHEVLDEAGLRVAEQMRFEPARNRGDEVAVWVSIPVRFELDSSPDAPRPSVRRETTLPPPVEVPPPPPSGSDAEGPVFIPHDEPPELSDPDALQQATREHYPALLRDAGIGGTTTAWLHIDAEGRVQEVRVNEASGQENLDQAALRVARDLEFSPARNRGEAVAVWVSIPIRFQR